MPRRASTTVPVLETLTRHMGVAITIGQLCQETGFNEGQVQPSMSRLLQSGQHNIEVIARGRMWIYRGPISVLNRTDNRSPSSKSTSNRMFEEIGKAKDGSFIILQGEDGSLFKGVEL